MRKRRPQQRNLSFGWGGWREGAGRKPVTHRRTAAPHRRRAEVRARYPLHITVRFRRELGSMRTPERVAVIRSAFVIGCRRPGFRVIDWSIQGNHLHLIVEAHNTSSLSRGMQGFCVRVARRLNVHLGRKGSVFAERYRARVLKTPREVRAVKAYVINNHHRHTAENHGVFLPGIDTFSSWAWFDGWRDCPRRQIENARGEQEATRPVARARTWLLTKGWRRHGLVSIDEVPGRPSTRRARGKPSAYGSDTRGPTRPDW